MVYVNRLRMTALFGGDPLRTSSQSPPVTFFAAEQDERPRGIPVALLHCRPGVARTAHPREVRLRQRELEQAPRHLGARGCSARHARDATGFLSLAWDYILPVRNCK